MWDTRIPPFKPNDAYLAISPSAQQAKSCALCFSLAPTHLKVGQAFAKKGAGSAGSSAAVHLNLEKRSARLCP